MGNEQYEVMSYDQEERWYATVLHIVNGHPVFVYRVPCDPPTSLEPTNEPGDIPALDKLKAEVKK